ncbi:Wall-associated receptor kinase [Quillaja saponaria]|uniref:non-specific serine/threonine protein kinase n=1 Tax=Quillaja saponaria TaxID=32244 RepID=A0AAD7KP76_QUISA|nr:Wall-associated receptor kinase [Quillaja saponaria]
MNQKGFISPSCPLTSLLFYIICFSLLTKFTLFAVDPQFDACRSQNRTCGDGQNISFPFYILGQQESYCGYPGFEVSCNKNGNPILKLSYTQYIIRQIFYNNQSLRVSNAAFSMSNTNEDACIGPTQNISFPTERFKFDSSQNDIFLFYDCNSSSLPKNLLEYAIGCPKEKQKGTVLALYGEELNFSYAYENCKGGMVETKVEGGFGNEIDRIGEALRRGFVLKWTASDCNMCTASGGWCGFNETFYQFKCYCPDRPHSSDCSPVSEAKDSRTMKVKRALKLGLGLGLGIGSLIIMISLLILWQYKRKHASSDFQSRNTNSDPSSNSDLETGSFYFGVLVFSYSELEEATNNFDHNKELGDGGFGTVYHGKLRDGREVAVKRLYENNYRRVEQFMNEVKILTLLRHKNLVSLYGCTSWHSRELLLVYEYIPNGTIADHIHGDYAKPGSPPWSIRMKIAIETASALAYLHASDIVHRDVKTNNILLDNNYCVKVADFGLSRLFPNHVTHISTAPQGTPGYVDPEYHQCYQLTSKSDVYSFGVVLIELISSMPAVDITRHRHEINLANLAITKIQKSAFNELVDPTLGFESDNEVKRMTISVGELAFQCLQQDKEMRPSMDEVLQVLKRIESRNDDDPENLEETDFHDRGIANSVQPPPPPSPDCDEAGLLKNMKLPPPSPNTVTDKWDSKSTTANSSG